MISASTASFANVFTINCWVQTLKKTSDEKITPAKKEDSSREGTFFYIISSFLSVQLLRDGTN